MRLVLSVLGVLMVLFMVVQVNDPDGWFWAAIYAVPAFWCALVVSRNRWVDTATGKYCLWLCTGLAFVAVIYYWPSAPAFWRQSVWYKEETAREGMGMMIVFAVLLLIAWDARQRSRASHRVT